MNLLVSREHVLDIVDGLHIFFKIITAETKFVKLVRQDILLQCIGNPDNIILSGWNSLDVLLERNSFWYEWSTINGT
jgi:hypothetical protein